MDTNTPWQKYLPLPQEFIPMQLFSKKDSLTAALKKLPAIFSVQLLNLGTSAPLLDEKSIFAGTKHSDMRVREVVLNLNQQPVVFARSICHQDSENWLDILDRGNSPLGEKLFDGSLPISRSNFEYRIMQPETYFSSVFKPHETLSLCLARRSVFWLEEKPLLLTEIFLPSLKLFL